MASDDADAPMTRGGDSADIFLVRTEDAASSGSQHYVCACIRKQAIPHRTNARFTRARNGAHPGRPLMSRMHASA